MAHGSKKAVITAIIANACVTIIKFFAAIVSGSAAMMNEAVHSLMDTLNQGFLFIGLTVGERPADQTYAFGHGQKKYLWNLWSAIGLFSIGAGLGLSHAWHAWHDLGHAAPEATLTLMGVEVSGLLINLLVLGTALLLEGYSFVIASLEFLRKMRADGESNPFAYLLTVNDPTLVAVVLEDSVAMLGLSFAALGIGLAAWTGNAAWDVGFSALIAVMLGVVAFYLGFVNMRFLADMRDSQAEQALIDACRQHTQIERYHDLRSIVVDESHTVLVAEIELREESMVADLRPRITARERGLMQAVPEARRDDGALQEYIEARAAVECVLERTEQIVDEIEAAIRTRLPRVSHITLEIQGIAESSDNRLRS